MSQFYSVGREMVAGLGVVTMRCLYPERLQWSADEANGSGDRACLMP